MKDLTQQRLSSAIAWCLAWGDQRTPQHNQATLQQIRQANPPVELAAIVQEAHQLLKDDFPFPKTVEELKSLTQTHPLLWNSEIGLVYGGATKIKQYVFEAAKLPDIRGASALLDRINLVDLPAFFGGENDDRFPQCKADSAFCQNVRDQWLEESFPGLAQALIPELIIYSTGGNILALCPAAFVQDLANAIEKRYTHETLTANSCAVGEKFKPLELRLGKLNPIETTFWREQYLAQKEHPLVKAYFDQPDIDSAEEKFKSRKNFSELVGGLAEQFTQRRNGNQSSDRPSRAYPPIYETHPYAQRDEGEHRSAIFRAQSLPDTPWLSEPIARKRLMGQITKRDDALISWWKDLRRENPSVTWQSGKIESWVTQFEKFLDQHSTLKSKYFDSNPTATEARSLREIGDSSKGFVAYIYADGNNMGGYIRRRIKTPQAYQSFSESIFEATQQSVYIALANHLHPHFYKPDPQSTRKKADFIHPFEIITIGGDDVLLVVPADRALEIAKTIAEEFEKQLADKYPCSKTSPDAHRYRPESAPVSKCELSMSMGVLITAEDTPIYYADQLVGQLLKSAKKRAKDLKQKHHYYSGTIDFLVMKAVTMISSNISEFRNQGLTKEQDKQPTLKLFAAPYTLHEIDGLIATVRALKEAKFPRSQLYQLRSLLERGKRTAILNYRYFRVRLTQGQAELKHNFEEAWCKPEDCSNQGNLAPWMLAKRGEKGQPSTYETIWRELVDLYPFVSEVSQESPALSNRQGEK
ncbi:type III-B CRISPR-associated protein Cas10/Cmr2 [Leptolyngbya sp. AN03gr2]|uniref:type III-B CRISPR-associated protein Cas10/Cmr2 n=1 Tax=unclassified Leptolyngbya TaxID=2650499 RepID=UPI003D321066